MTFYYCDALVGGTGNALDGIDPLDMVGDSTGVLLAVDDQIEVFEDDARYIYKARSSAGAVENAPLVIVPDTNPGNWWYELIEMTSAGPADVLAYANLPGGL